MARTIVCLLHPGPPAMGWWARAWLWCLERLGRELPRLEGPVSKDPHYALSMELERRLGRRYRCLPVVPRPGPTRDEFERELKGDDRAVLVVIEPQPKPQLRNRLVRRARRSLGSRAVAIVPCLREQSLWLEAEHWCDRMARILQMSNPEGPSTSPSLTSCPSLSLDLAEAIRTAERDQGWTVPEDWVREAVIRAWEAIDQGQSVDAATTLPEPIQPVLPWLDSFLATQADKKP